MPAYRYEAADAQGRLERGLIDADSPRAARAQLRARGLTALDVQTLADSPMRRGWRLGPRLRDSDLAHITRQLASLLEASLPIDAALAAVAEQAERRHVADVLGAVRADVRAGHRLADALATRPHDFPPVYRALVAAGEASGDLSEVMGRLADYIETRAALRGKVLTAFLYPAVVSLVSVAIVIFLLSYVVPQVVSAFSQARQALPWLTRAVLAASHFVRDWGWLVGVALVALVIAARTLLRQPGPRLAWDTRLLRLPLAGRFALGVDTARFASTLAILVSSGVPLLRALEAARDTLVNTRLRSDVDLATERVREGSGLAQALQRTQRLPPLLIHLTASGEKTGNLGPLLQRAAETLSRELERRAMAMTALLEPLLILLMGGVVLIIVLAVLLPIIELNQLIA